MFTNGSCPGPGYCCLGKGDMEDFHVFAGLEPTSVDGRYSYSVFAIEEFPKDRCASLKIIQVRFYANSIRFPGARLGCESRCTIRHL